MREVVLDFVFYRLDHGMVCRHTQGLETLPGMHCELRSRSADVSRAIDCLLLTFIDTENPTDNDQQEAVDCNLDL